MKKYNSIKLTTVGIAMTVASMLYITGCIGGSGNGNGGNNGGDTDGNDTNGSGTVCITIDDDTLPGKCSNPIEATISNGIVRIGGSTTAVERATIGEDEWTFYNVANELRATMVGLPEGVPGVEVEGFIRDIEIVTYNDKRYALLAMGEEGITMVDVTSPTAMGLIMDSVKVNYYQDGISWAEGSGNIVNDQNISSTRASISSIVAFDDDNNVSTPPQLIIGNEDYGLHKTNWVNLEGAREVDGTLAIDEEIYTLQYAGENPWGGPKSLTLFGEGNSTRLFVAKGFMGMGIYDPKTLKHVGHYNLYTDATEDNNGEDWFYDMDVATVVQNAYIDSCTGMPDYNQAAYEINTYKDNKDIDTPWADFENAGGKYYYDARKIDIETFDGNTTAYIAYGMAGVIAIDVNGYDTTTDTNCSIANPNFFKAKYLGYVPAIPAHGPDDRLIGSDEGSVFSRAGAGMLKDAGVADVKVDMASNKVFYVDHFGGLMVIDNASTPAAWHGPDGLYNYDNDTNKSVPHLPSYDFVSSYAMSPVDETNDESLPLFTKQTPILLTTGEVGGHGTALTLTGSGFDPDNSVPSDVIVAAGAGGLSFIEVYGADSYEHNITYHLATTNELGADENNEATVPLSIGHSAGVGTYDNLLYLADGPHGMTVWKVADKACNNIPAEDVRLVGNTLQAEDPYVIDENNTIYPTPHADEVVIVNDGVNKSALVASLGAGLRRVNVNEMGAEDAPRLIYPTKEDIYLHSTEEVKVDPNINFEDRVYDVAVRGDLAFTADGLAGVTVYDLSKTPDLNNSSGFLVGNIKVGTNATGIELSGNYAFVAAGSKGISVIDICDPSNMKEIKTFEPIKWEDLETNPKAHDADGIAVDVKIMDGYAFFTYDSFGVLAYKIDDLINPDYVNPDDTDNRPDAVGYFKVQNALTYTNNVGTDFTDWGGGASGIDAITTNAGKKLFYIAYGEAGVFKLDWTDLWTLPVPANHDTISPKLEEHVNTAGAATDVSVWNGRVYVADGTGGLVLVD